MSKSIEPKGKYQNLNKNSLVEKPKSLVKDLAQQKKVNKSAFELFLNPQIQELDLKIESKQRILDSLQSKDWELVPLATQNFIEKQTSVLSDLESELSKLKKQKQDSAMQNSLEKIAAELREQLENKEKLETNLLEIQENLKKTDAEWETEKEKLEEQEQLELEEQQSLKNEILLKDLEIQFVKDKIFQISDKLTTIKELNSNFNKNIEAINAQIEIANRRFYEAKIKAEHNLSIKEKIVQALDESCENERFCYKKTQKIKKFAKFFETKQEHSAILEELKENIESSLKIIPNYQKEESALELEKNITSLSFPSQKLDEKLKKDKISENPIEIQLVSLYKDLKVKELELKQKQKNDPIKETQILELKSTLNSDNSIIEEKLAYLAKQLEFFSSQYDSVQGKIEESRKELSKKQAKIGKTNENLGELLEKLEKMNAKSLNSATDELKTKAEELRNKVFKSSENLNSSDSSEKEKRISSYLLQLEILRQEVLKKDSEIVLRLREKQKADEMLEGFKVQQNKLFSKIKTVEKEILEKINNELDTKDKQIMVLKEMLRGSHGELKVKDIVLHSFRSKLDEVSKSIR